MGNGRQEGRQAGHWLEYCSRLLCVVQSQRSRCVCAALRNTGVSRVPSVVADGTSKVRLSRRPKRARPSADLLDVLVVVEEVQHGRGQIRVRLLYEGSRRGAATELRLHDPGERIPV